MIMEDFHRDIWATSNECNVAFLRITKHEISRSSPVVKVLHQRFEQWASDLGVFVRPHLSLDARLMYSETLRGLVLQLLHIVQRNLGRIVREHELPVSGDSENEALNSIINQMGRRPVDGLSSILVESLQALESAVDALDRLGVAIRQSSSSSLAQRIAAFMEKSNDGVLEKVVYLHLKHRLVDREGDIPGAALSLCRQLAVSVSFRYFGILYRRSHETKKIDKKPIARRGHESAKGPEGLTLSILARERGPAVTTSKNPQNPGVIPRHVFQSDTAPSIPNSKAAMQKYTSSPKSGFESKSVVSIQTPQDLKHPKPPKIGPLESDAMCPYCGLRHNKSKYEQKSWWQAHVEQELKPYTCISEECAEPPQLFSRYEEWKQHMDSEHSTQWISDVHRPLSWCCAMDEELFDGEDMFEDHIKANHLLYSKEPELAGFNDWCEVRLPRPPHTCPVCNAIPEKLAAILPQSVQANPNLSITPSKLQMKDQDKDVREELLLHIGLHLKQVGFMAITYLEEDGSDNDSRATLGDNMRCLPPGEWVQGEWEPAVEPYIDKDYLHHEDDCPKLLDLEVDYTNVWTTLKQLSQLATNLCNARITWPPGRESYFVPWDDIERLVTVNTVLAELQRCEVGLTQDELLEIVNTIVTTARKLFSTLVCQTSAEHIFNFLKEGLCDKDMPFVKVALQQQDPRAGSFRLESRRHKGKVLQCMAQLTRSELDGFNRDQWWVLAPVFKQSKKERKMRKVRHWELEDNRVLPFILDEESRNGSRWDSNEVWAVRIHPVHQRLYRGTDPKNPNPKMAIKRLSSTRDADFVRKTEMLKAFSDHENPHLVKLLATYRYRNRYHLMFPLAAGNLRDYWAATKVPEFSDETMKWSLVQCKGIASALMSIHEYRNTIPEPQPEPSSHLSEQANSQHGTSPVSNSQIMSQGASDNSYVLHGDIKPENILWSCEGIQDKNRNNDLGTLLITDFGLQSTDSFHGIITSPTYEPPDRLLKIPISKKFDIWSLGCVYLEFITWLVGGEELLSKFPDARDELIFSGEMYDDTYFTIRPEDPKKPDGKHFAFVRPKVTEWIRNLRKKFRYSDFIHDFLDLIEYTMLRVEPGDRISWSQLNFELAKMLEKANQNEPYLTKTAPIGRRLKKARIEWPLGQSRYFVPIDLLDHLLTSEAILLELRKTYTEMKDEELIFSYEKTISTSGKRLYALLLYEDRGQFIGKFLDEGIGDADLPFERVDREDSTNPLGRWEFDLYRSSHKGCTAANHRLCGIKVLASWEEIDIVDLYRDQWVFQAPVFEANDAKIPHLELDDNATLPFTFDQEGKSVSRGGYSDVWAVRIHSAHQKLYKSSDTSVAEPLLAIKRPFSRDLRDFEKEVNMLKYLSVQNHPHLIRLLATYKFKDNYHLVFPFANSNLRGYWDDTEIPHWNKDTYSWFLRQLRGITSGLNAIHNFKADLNIRSQDSLDGKSLTLPNQEAKFGRHGDIKPENILWSNEIGTEGEWGILQIADMGLHGIGWTDRSTVHGFSPTYAAPEIDLEKPVSRAYDIWSLGCVFLEFITWLVEGSLRVDEFSSARGQIGEDGINGDMFYTIINIQGGTKSAVVRESVTQWIERLHSHSQCSLMIRDLLRIVKNQMLVIESRQRITIKDLDAQLRLISTKCENMTEYLLGKDAPILDPGLGVKLPKPSASTLYRPAPAANADTDRALQSNTYTQ